MNSPTLLFLASIVASSMRSGCAAPEVPERHGVVLDQSELELSLNAICAVGSDSIKGVLIGKRWVLTTSSEVDASFKEREVDLKVVFNNAAVYFADNVFVHSTYGSSRQYDIALLELKEEVHGIEPVPMPVLLGTEGTLSVNGIGQIDEVGFTVDSILRSSQVREWIDAVMSTSTVAVQTRTLKSEHAGS